MMFLRCHLPSVDTGLEFIKRVREPQAPAASASTVMEFFLLFLFKHVVLWIELGSLN